MLLSGAELRQVLQVGLWEALADGSDRAAMRATCRDARDMQTRCTTQLCCRWGLAHGAMEA
jgi:hypothetical protein